MAGLLGFLAAGAAQGAGAGIVAEAKARREAAIAELENSRLLSREQTDRDFRASEGAKDRAATAEQNRLSRRETISGADGTAMILDGDTATPIKDSAGNPIKTARMADDNSPAEVRTAEWLIEKGVAASPEEAWSLIRRSREDAFTAKDLEEMVEKAVDTEFGGSMVPPTREKLDEARARNRERIRRNLGMDEPAAAPSTSSAPASVARPEGATDAQLISEAKVAIERGAPAEAVRSRLTSMGVDPSAAGL